MAGTVATAPSDGTRLRSGTSKGCGASGCALVDGPFVLTDANAIDLESVTFFYTVPQSGSCAVNCNTIFSGGGADAEIRMVVSARSNISANYPNHVAGAAHLIGANQRLCMCPQGAGYPWLVSWSGFTPYQ